MMTNVKRIRSGDHDKDDSLDVQHSSRSLETSPQFSLPTVIQFIVFGSLELNDLSEFLYVSKLYRKIIRNYLQQCSEIHIDSEYTHNDCQSFNKRLFLMNAIPMKLRYIRVNISNMEFVHAKYITNSLTTLVQQNNRTIRTIDVSLSESQTSCPDLNKILRTCSRCPLLESVEFGEFVPSVLNIEEMVLMTLHCTRLKTLSFDFQEYINDVDGDEDGDTNDFEESDILVTLPDIDKLLELHTGKNDMLIFD
jgi:hypothetical protein